MTIREDFQPAIEEFITDLHAFATGSYLRPGETEYWEAPFDAEVLPQLQSILERYLDALDALVADPPAEELVAVAATCVTELATFNDNQEGAVIEPEEQASIRAIMVDAAAQTGADDEALAELSDLEPERV